MTDNQIIKMNIKISDKITEVDKDFWFRCNKYGKCDIDLSFMGFLDIYKNLSEIIPQHKIIVDCGCAYATQAVYFQKHKKYIGIDISDCPKVKTKNSEYHKKSIKEWIDKELSKYDKKDLFAICSYVPPWVNDNEKLVRENFKNLFVYYP
jgi:hypothetical protein